MSLFKLWIYYQLAWKRPLFSVSLCTVVVLASYFKMFVIHSEHVSKSNYSKLSLKFNSIINSHSSVLS